MVSCRILQSPGKSPNTSLLPEENTPDIEQSNQWNSDQVQWTSMMNFHESITMGQLEGIRNPVAVKRVRMGSCASDDKTGFGPGDFGRTSSPYTPNDEERLEQMVHPKTKVLARRTPLERWNGLAWVCTPWLWKKVEWTCWGLYGMAMERSCSLWRRREFWDHSVPPNTTRSTRLCVGVT